MDELADTGHPDAFYWIQLAEDHFVPAKVFGRHSEERGRGMGQGGWGGLAGDKSGTLSAHSVTRAKK